MTPKEKKLYDWISRVGVLLDSQIHGSDMYNAQQSLKRAGLVEHCDHPTVKDGMGYPADATRIKRAREEG